MCETNGQNCILCPVECGAVREKKAGYCGVTGLKIAKYGLHLYEEPCISYGTGSGAVFFCGCALRCVFCQNYELSRSARGKEITPSRLAEIFQELETMGAANINLVTPSHFAEQLIETFSIYRPKVPVVYNTHSYEKIETLERLDPFIDIYLPDMKFCERERALRYTGRADYFDRASAAIEFMCNKKRAAFKGGKMLSGVIVRHLTLPLGTGDTLKILDWFETLPNEPYLSLMSQYTPFGNIDAFPELKRKITAREYRRAAERASALGHDRVFLQMRTSSNERFIPDWDE